MGVYIKGMEMPKPGRYEAVIIVLDKSMAEIAISPAEDDIGYWKEYPLVLVPPHGRLGDLEKLEQMFVDIDNAPYSGFDGSEPFYSAEDAAQIIRLTPTIIPAEEE